MLRRHDLLQVQPAAWTALLADHGEWRLLPSVAAWAELGRPVIVRRRLAGDSGGSVPAALPLPPSTGKLRLAFSLPMDAVVSLPPVRLRDIAGVIPSGWTSAVSQVLELGSTLRVEPQVFGAALWENLTGLAYVTATSDLDLLWPMTDARCAQRLLDGLLRIDASSAVRLDGELVSPEGAAVNWRELAQADARDTVLVKTMDAVALRTRDAFFGDLDCSH